MTKDVKNHKTREVLDLIAELYKVADEASESQIEGSDEHLALRQTRSRKLVTSIWQWFDARNGKHSPKSKMGGPITYAIKQRKSLERFLDDSHLRLDNNIAERALRIIALGRKNSMFSGMIGDNYFCRPRCLTKDCYQRASS